jgi:hypothetical protein
MTGRPTNAASRSGIKSHVTKWLNTIQDYQNVSVDLGIRNIILGAEQNLRTNYNKFDKFSIGVARDQEAAKAIQEDLDREQELLAKMDEDFNAALVIVKTKNRSIRKTTKRGKKRGRPKKRRYPS